MKNIKASESKKLALHYMKTLVDVARESFLILDSKLRVITANPDFYQRFLTGTPKTRQTVFHSSH